LGDSDLIGGVRVVDNLSGDVELFLERIKRLNLLCLVESVPVEGFTSVEGFPSIEGLVYVEVVVWAEDVVKDEGGM
jgi:hypothetical protein